MKGELKMTNKELFGRLKEMAKEVNDLSSECKRYIEISTSVKTPNEVWINIGQIDDPYKEYVDIWNDEDGWNYLVFKEDGSSAIIKDIADFDMEGKKDGH